MYSLTRMHWTNIWCENISTQLIYKGN